MADAETGAPGVASLSEVTAVVLETDGTFSVVRGEAGEAGSLKDVWDAARRA